MKKNNYKKQTVETRYALSLQISMLIVFCFPVLLYLQTLSFDLTHFDDDLLVVSNSTFLNHHANIPRAFTTDAFFQKQSVFYRPLQTLSYMFDLFLSGQGKFWMFHLGNVLLLGFIASSLYVLLLQFQIPQKLALLGTLLYSTHPLFVPTVAWIPARGDLQLTLFSVLAVIFLIKYFQNEKPLFALLHFASFILALFCKETAAILPLLFLLYVLTMTNKRPFDKKILLFGAMYVLLGLLWFMLRSNAIAPASEVQDIVGLKALPLTIRTVPEALAKFVIPIGIVPFPGFTMLKTGIGVTIICFILFIFFKTKTVSVNRKLFGLGWFLIFMLPTLFFKHAIIDYLDHRFLLPLIGFYLFILFIVPKSWLEQYESKLSGAMLALILLFGISTFIKSSDYANARSFYNAALQQANISPMVYHNRGCLMIADNGNLGAIDEYTKAITMKPDYVDALINRGAAYIEVHQFDKAIADLKKAITLSPNNAKTYYNLGCAYQDIGVHDKAITNFNQAIAIKTDYFGAYINRGTSFEALNQLDKTIADYTTALKLKPDYEATYFFRGIIYYKQGKYDDAIADYTKGIALNPNYFESYYNRGFAFFCLKKYNEAIADYTRAITLKPDFAEVYSKRALAYYSLNMEDKTIADFTKAIEIDPKFAETYNNRGVIYYKKGLNDKARNDFTTAAQLGSEKAKANLVKYFK